MPKKKIKKPIATAPSLEAQKRDENEKRYRSAVDAKLKQDDFVGCYYGGWPGIDWFTGAASTPCKSDPLVVRPPKPVDAKLRTNPTALHSEVVEGLPYDTTALFAFDPLARSFYMKPGDPLSDAITKMIRKAVLKNYDVATNVTWMTPTGESWTTAAYNTEADSHLGMPADCLNRLMGKAYDRLNASIAKLIAKKTGVDIDCRGTGNRRNGTDIAFRAKVGADGKLDIQVLDFVYTYRIKYARAATRLFYGNPSSHAKPEDYFLLDKVYREINALPENVPPTTAASITTYFGALPKNIPPTTAVSVTAYFGKGGEMVCETVMINVIPRVVYYSDGENPIHEKYHCRSNIAVIDGKDMLPVSKLAEASIAEIDKLAAELSAGKVAHSA